MSQFASKAFSSSGYAAARPRYTAHLLKEIIAYHRGSDGSEKSIDMAVDLGCGPGTITNFLGQHSSRVLALDPSANMIQEAQRQLEGVRNVEIKQGSADALPHALQEPADLIVSAQAAHWFHSPPNNKSDCELWKSLGRALKSGGSLVYLAYGDIEILNHPHLSAFTRVKDTLNPYWQQPGRRFLVNLLRDVEFPEWGVNQQRVFYDSSTEYRLRNTTSIAAFADYIATWSSYSKYCESHPSNTLIDDLKMDVMEEIGGDHPLEVAFPVTLFMCQKA